MKKEPNKPFILRQKIYKQLEIECPKCGGHRVNLTVTQHGDTYRCRECSYVAKLGVVVKEKS